MKTAHLHFRIKRGVVEMEGLEDDAASLVGDCLKLVREGQHEKAIQTLRQAMKFEWIWGNGGGDPTEVGASGEDLAWDLNSANNPELLVGEEDGALVITASVNFEIGVGDEVDEETLGAFLDDNSCSNCGVVSAGWGYSGSDGEELRVLSV